MVRTRFVSFCVVAAILLFCSSGLKAQQAPAPRIVNAIDESALTTLRGGVSGLARAEYDRGRAPASTAMTSVRLVLARTPQQQAALEAFLAQQNEPGSPNYHHWLTPQEFGKLYGPADSDIDMLVTWLQSHGFTVQPVAPGRASIAFSGSVAQMEAAFHTEIHSFDTGRKQFLANVTNPSIPSALAPVVSGLAHFNTIQPRSHSVPGGLGKLDPQSKRLTRADASAGGITPMMTTYSSGEYSLFLTAGDAATIYNTPNSFNANYVSSGSNPSYTGAGVTIGIGGEALIQTSTVQNYRSTFLGSTYNVAPTITNDTKNPSTTCTSSDPTCAEDEAYLDVETSGAVAPGATIHFYTSSDLYSAIDDAISDNTVDIFSLSFGLCEAEMTTSDNAALNNYWLQFSGQGIPVTVSTGDSGSASCDDDSTETAASDGLQVSGFASTPYDIAVGGTDFYALLSNFTTYVSTNNTSTYSSTGPNTPATFYTSALSYIPESTWNDSTYPNTTISADVPYIDSQTNKGSIVAGSGGASSCSTNNNTTTLTNCISGYTKPSWQRGAGVPSDKVRDVPDVSMMAGNGFYSAAWLVCTDDTDTSDGTTITGNCLANSSGEFYFYGFGGTSASAPAFAGILALVQQAQGGAGHRLGLAAKNLYDLYNNSTYAPLVFHDTTVGNNSVPCVADTPNCSENTAGNYFLTSYNTGTGYDLATGLGSVNATQLATNWTAAEGAAATVTVTPSATSITTNQSLSVAVTASGASGTPTGTVTLSGGGYTSSAGTLSSGAYTFTIPAGSLTAGSDTLSVFYSGDSTYSSATSTASVTVTALNPTVTATPSATSIESNQPLTLAVSVTGTGPTPTGQVQLIADGYKPLQTLSAGTTTFNIPAGTLTAGTASLSVTYQGNSVYNTQETYVSVAVTQFTQYTPTVTVTPASTSIDAGQPLSVTVAVTGSGPTPAGTIMLSGGGYVSSTQTLSSGSYTFTIPADSLGTSVDAPDTLTATYSGDADYLAGTGTASVTVGSSVYTLSGTTPASISPGAGASSTITVGTSTYYVGTVTLSCSLTTLPTGAVSAYNPTCSVTGSPVTLSSSTTSGTATVNFFTTAASSAAVRGTLASSRSGWLKSGVVTLAALLVFFGIPARRRAWRATLGIVVLIAALGALAACGGGSGSGGGGGGGGGNSTPGTTAGNYTFTITGAPSVSGTSSQTTTITLTVN